VPFRYRPSLITSQRQITISLSTSHRRDRHLLRIGGANASEIAILCTESPPSLAFGQKSSAAMSTYTRVHIPEPVPFLQLRGSLGRRPIALCQRAADLLEHPSTTPLIHCRYDFDASGAFQSILHFRVAHRHSEWRGRSVCSEEIYPHTRSI